MAETLDPLLPERLDRLAREVLDLAKERDAPISVAESCTGGLLAALLTDVQGRSHMFERGFVVYSDGAKCDLLGIEREMVDDCGAVSRPVALAMAKGALNRADAGVALSVTGFAGPGGDDDEEGLVHFACVRDGGEPLHRECHYGAVGRDGVRIAALETALEMMRDALRA
ncbi:nicotinamide-nucleotide amidohydrolase family protein [Erythrobacter sp. 3-20A1M]|uniref:CinA family protein n=1 Tax=Erythrobacter sp. 3-20A1M TaxID=2653850 RepID=UPI001BFC87A8|nr:CinA family protein [Erythrobacter sp. 3-20A1M]QWC55970.1 nicotinamide-nucleotide amidohydrolase family protein [Erythrobacter sp. 3-20A1M]